MVTLLSVDFSEVKGLKIPQIYLRWGWIEAAPPTVIALRPGTAPVPPPALWRVSVALQHGGDEASVADWKGEERRRCGEKHCVRPLESI